jgi:hypothetical protein
MFLFSLMKKEPKKSRKKEASTHKASPGPPFFQACAHLPIKSLAVKQESSVVNPFDVIAVHSELLRGAICNYTAPSDQLKMVITPVHWLENLIVAIHNIVQYISYR